MTNIIHNLYKLWNSNNTKLLGKISQTPPTGYLSNLSRIVTELVHINLMIIVYPIETRHTIYLVNFSHSLFYIILAEYYN